MILCRVGCKILMSLRPSFSLTSAWYTKVSANSSLVSINRTGTVLSLMAKRCSRATLSAPKLDTIAILRGANSFRATCKTSVALWWRYFLFSAATSTAIDLCGIGPHRALGVKRGFEWRGPKSAIGLQKRLFWLAAEIQIGGNQAFKRR